eukprot:6896355-Pyramimonas_sp.AAC.1
MGEPMLTPNSDFFNTNAVQSRWCNLCGGNSVMQLIWCYPCGALQFTAMRNNVNPFREMPSTAKQYNAMQCEFNATQMSTKQRKEMQRNDSNAKQHIAMQRNATQG